MLRHYLRRDIIWRSAKGFRGFIALYILLAHAKVGDFYVSILIQQHVVQLQIAINDAACVKEKQPDGDFGRVEPVAVNGKSLKVSQ